MNLPRRAQEVALRHPILLVWFGMLMYSTGPVMVAASSVDGAVFSMMRLALGVPVIGLVALGAPRSQPSLIPRRAWRWTVLSGLAFGTHQLFFMTAVKLTSVTDVVLMNTLAPIVVMALAVPMFDERTDGRFRSWTAVAIAGAMIVALGGGSGPEGDPVGMLMAGVNVVFFSLFFLFSKAARPHVDVWPFLSGVIAIAAALVGTYFVVTGRTWATATGTDWALAAAVAAGPGAFGHFFMTWPLARIRANLPPVIRLLQPISAGGLAWLTLGQVVTLPQLAGGALTIVGVLGVLGFLSSESRPPLLSDVR